jgi:formylglycine-generating enzyme required for sulfatase activity
MENISWNDTQEFIRKLNQKEKTRKYRLPTEAEWEYACNAGSTAIFCYGNDKNKLEEYSWYINNSEKKTHPVGQKKPNKWGLYDMHGNLWEWCQDLKNEYPSGAVINPTGPSKGLLRVCRGGSWRNYAGGVRSAYRDYVSPSRGDNFIGFRIVRMP